MIPREIGEVPNLDLIESSLMPSAQYFSKGLRKLGDLDGTCVVRVLQPQMTNENIIP
jgi:hypothetical protein